MLPRLPGERPDEHEPRDAVSERSPNRSADRRVGEAIATGGRRHPGRGEQAGDHEQPGPRDRGLDVRSGDEQHDGGGERCECEQGQLECPEACDAGDGSLPLQPCPSQCPVVDAEAPGHMRRSVNAAAGDDRPRALPEGNVRPSVHPRNVAERERVADVAGNLCADANREPDRVEARCHRANSAEARGVGHERGCDHCQRSRGCEDDQIPARLRRLHTTSIEP